MQYDSQIASSNKQKTNKTNSMTFNKFKVMFYNSLTSGTAETLVSLATLYFHIMWFDV
jgi:hypothetical protein